MNPHDNKSSTLQDELKSLRGSDPLLDHLLSKGPVTRESYLAHAYPEGPPAPLPAELEAQLPKPLQQMSAALPPETEAEGKKLGELRLAKMRAQNAALHRKR